MSFEHDPIGFIDQHLPKNEKGKRWTLSPHQRRVLAHAFVFGDDGLLGLRLLLWSELKKSGKSFLAAALTLWWAFTRPDTEVLVAANDLEQAASRVFATILALLKHNPELQRSAKATANLITLSNGTTIKAIPSDFRGEAGARHSLAVFDELWGYDSERAQRLFEELTPPPSEPDAWLLVVSSAGFVGESVLLERLYQRGIKGERVDSELEVYRDDDMVMFWSETPRQPWQTDKYYAQQRKLLRPSTFARLHENRWVTAESVFITPELWDACVDPMHRPILRSKDPVYIGIDAATKSDCSAVVAVRWAGECLQLVRHRMWRPTPGQPLSLEHTVESFILELNERMNVGQVLADPFQMARSVSTLKDAGIPIAEFAQTVGGTTKMGSSLYDVIRGRNLILYPDEELRQQALNVVAIEHARGWRMAKERATKKIDGIVALSMAVIAALDRAAPKKKYTSATWGRPDGPSQRPSPPRVRSVIPEERWHLAGVFRRNGFITHSRGDDFGRAAISSEEKFEAAVKDHAATVEMMAHIVWSRFRQRMEN